MKFTRKELIGLHQDFCDEARNIMRAKSSDYSPHHDPFINFKSAKMLGISPELSVLMRVIDKVQRLAQYAKDNKLFVNDESAQDSMKDIINYIVILQGLILEKE